MERSSRTRLILDLRSLVLSGGLLIAGICMAIFANLRMEAESELINPPPAAIEVQASPPPPRQTVKRERAAAVSKVPGPITDSGSLPAFPALAEQLVGVWTFERHGHRTITILPDGSATADVRLDLLGSLMYGERLNLQLTWSLEDDVMIQTVLSGTPASAVKRLIDDWGDRREYRVIDVSSSRLVLADVDDENDQQIWTRSDTTVSTSKPVINEKSPRPEVGGS